jgi:hypothetical protein
VIRLPRPLRILIWIDLTICALFALPWLSGQLLALLSRLNAALGLGGEPVVMGFFVNLAGLFGVAFNAILLKSNVPAHHQINNFARLAVILLIAFYLMAGALPLLFGLFILTELIGLLVTRRWLSGLRHAG